jgi:hypothetical protein
MKAVGSGGGSGCGGGGGGSGGRRWTLALMAVDGERAASSPIDVGGGKAIVGIQWTMAGGRMLVGGRIIYYQNLGRVKIAKCSLRSIKVAQT